MSSPSPLSGKQAVEHEEKQHTGQQEIPLTQRQQHDEYENHEHVHPEDEARPFRLALRPALPRTSTLSHPSTFPQGCGPQPARLSSMPLRSSSRPMIACHARPSLWPAAICLSTAGSAAHPGAVHWHTSRGSSRHPGPAARAGQSIVCLPLSSHTSPPVHPPICCT